MSVFKKLLSLIVIFIIVSTLNVTFAKEVKDERTVKKGISSFSKGIIRMVTSWFKIPQNIYEESKDKNPIAGFTYGTIKGTAETVKETADGSLDSTEYVRPEEKYPEEYKVKYKF